MATIINQNYSQFYRGMESLKSYGSNTAGKKDKLVRYEFNTHDEKGNKIMDQMSREETLRAMHEISAQYGDNVMVEFSGDGMAKLVESRKNGEGVNLDDIMGVSSEKQAMMDGMVVQLEGTHQKVSEDDEIFKKDNWHDNLREKAPKVCDELDDLMSQIFNHGLYHSDDGEKFGTKFIELVQKAEKAMAEYDEKKVNGEDSKSSITIGEAQLSETAQVFLKKLRETYGSMDFFAADFGRGDNAKDILAGAKNEYSVILSIEELEKMAADEEYAAEYMQKVQGAVRMSEQINREFGFISESGGMVGSTKVSKIGISLGGDGITTFFAELEKSSQQQKEQIEDAQEEKRAKERKRTERTFVQADSIEELIHKIKNVDWSIIAEE